MRTARVIALLLVPAAAVAADQAPTGDALVRTYDATMGAEAFDGRFTMVAHRDDGSMRGYVLRVVKSGAEKTRIWFSEPASVRGQEMLRQGENLWVYMPNLKRAVRIASRDSFQGGDFNNADVLRVNYEADYTAAVVSDASPPDAWLVELTAKTSEAAYERIKLWLSRAGTMPLRAEYFSASGKMLRSAEFSDVRDFGGLKRPAKIVMRNALAAKRFSEMTVDSFDARVKPAATMFVLDNLGR
jgi:outer membrane lipoprotein-sorting protein